MWGRSLIVRDWHDHYVVSLDSVAPPGYEPVELRETEVARVFLRRLWGHDADVLTGLLRLAATGGMVPLGGYHQGEVMERLASELALGSLHVFQKSRPILSATFVPRKRNPEAESEFDAEVTHFFAVRLVDDATGAPIVGCRLELALSDGAKRSLVTGSNGVAEAQGVPDGAHELGSPFGANTAYLTLVVAEGGKGNGASGGATKSPPRPPAAGTAWTIAKVKTRKVKTGDTLASIAHSDGLSPAQLAYFNFGVYEGPALERALRHRLGCTKKAKDGRYVLDDADDPGLVYLPSRWSQAGLAVDQQHTLRVKPVVKPPDVKLLYQFDPNQPGADNDTLTLETEDGSWSHELTVSAAPRPYAGWAALVFPAPPAGQRFNLIQDPKDGHEAFYVFRGISEDDLREALDEQVEAERAENEPEQAGPGESKEA